MGQRESGGLQIARVDNYIRNLHNRLSGFAVRESLQDRYKYYCGNAPGLCEDMPDVDRYTIKPAEQENQAALHLVINSHHGRTLLMPANRFDQ